MCAENPPVTKDEGYFAGAELVTVQGAELVEGAVELGTTGSVGCMRQKAREGTEEDNPPQAPEHPATTGLSTPLPRRSLGWGEQEKTGSGNSTGLKTFVNYKLVPRLNASTFSLGHPI